MRLGQSLAPRLCLSLQCSVCLRLRSADDDDDIAEIVLFGAKAYAACPCCRRIVHSPALMLDPEYRRRVRLWLFEHHGVVLRTP